MDSANSETWCQLEAIDNKEDDNDVRLLPAAKYGWQGLVETLPKQGVIANCPQRKGKRGHAGLTCAADHGHEGVVRLLVEYRGDLETRNQSTGLVRGLDKTSSSWAAGSGNVGVEQYLLEAGADPNGGEKDGRLTPLAVAAVRGYEDVVWVLLEKENIALDRKGTPDGRTVLSHSTEYGQQDIIIRLLEKGADSNSGDFVGRRPLFWAGKQSHRATVGILLTWCERESTG
ncbi:hypothetical protein N7457_004006 [Penicillium paradoxum]|uniref:uncharacterized protein n=1 Tax=Penicillium paradoxum TaxID=176176 RepID=UPI002547A2D9|nr:uncharacterized protein N7457_004006 [Penicillium paradoxum]KAJ5782232.1 hypothetical protein N7457_004006 [Penicillium paradoxum]